jgi:hypothetical protein
MPSRAGSLSADPVSTATSFAFQRVETGFLVDAAAFLTARVSDWRSTRMPQDPSLS